MSEATPATNAALKALLAEVFAEDLVALVGEELADILLYLVRLADKLGVDLVGAAHAKLASNALKYPVDKARGTSKKYTDL